MSDSLFPTDAITPTFVHQRPGGTIWHIRSDVWEWTLAEKHRLTVCSLPILGDSVEATDCPPKRGICKRCLEVHDEVAS